MSSVWKDVLRSYRKAVTAQHAHRGCWTHTDLGILALTNVMLPSLLDYLLCLSLSCSENLPGGSSLGPDVYLPPPFPVPLPPLRVPNVRLYPFFHLLGYLPPLTRSC